VDSSLFPYWLEPFCSLDWSSNSMLHVRKNMMNVSNQLHMWPLLLCLLVLFFTLTCCSLEVGSALQIVGHRHGKITNSLLLQLFRLQGLCSVIKTVFFLQAPLIIGCEVTASPWRRWGFSPMRKSSQLAKVRSLKPILSYRRNWFLGSRKKITLSYVPTIVMQVLAGPNQRLILREHMPSVG
jgi:hypothetical protein